MPRLRLFVLLAVPAVLFFALVKWGESQRPDVREEPTDALLARIGTDRFRHGDFIGQVVYRPDGRTIAASAHRRAEIREWDVTTGHELRRYADPALPNRFLGILGYTPDGRYLITLKNFDWVVTFDTTTGEMVSRIPYWDTIRLAPDGKSVIGRSPERRLTLWDVATGRVIREYPTDASHDISYSPDGRWIATALRVKEVKGEGESGRTIYRARAWVGPVDGSAGYVIEFPELVDDVTVHVVWLKSDRLFLGIGRQMATFDPATGERKVVAPPPRFGLRRVCVKDGRLFIETDGRIGVEYNSDTLTPTPNGRTYTEPAPGPTTSPDGRVLAEGYGHRIRFLDARTGTPLTQDAGDTLVSAPQVIRFSANGRRMLTTGGIETRVWELSERGITPRAETSRAMLFGGEIPDAHLSPGGGWVVGTDSKRGPNPFVVWDAATGAEVYRDPQPPGVLPPSHGQRVIGVDASGAWVFNSRTSDFECREVPSGRVLRTIRGFPQAYHAVLSPDGSRLASSSGITIAVRNTHPEATWRVIEEYTDRFQKTDFQTPPSYPMPLGFSRDGWKLMVGEWRGYDGYPTVRVVDVSGTPKPGEWLDIGRNPAFTPDGQCIATLAPIGSDSPRFIRISDATTGSELFRFDLRGEVAAFAFTPDGKRLVVAHVDTTLTVWDWNAILRANLR